MQLVTPGTSRVRNCFQDCMLKVVCRIRYGEKKTPSKVKKVLKKDQNDAGKGTRYTKYFYTLYLAYLTYRDPKLSS